MSPPPLRDAHTLQLPTPAACPPCRREDILFLSTSHLIPGMGTPLVKQCARVRSTLAPLPGTDSQLALLLAHVPASPALGLTFLGSLNVPLKSQ